MLGLHRISIGRHLRIRKNHASVNSTHSMTKILKTRLQLLGFK